MEEVAPGVVLGFTCLVPPFLCYHSLIHFPFYPRVPRRGLHARQTRQRDKPVNPPHGPVPILIGNVVNPVVSGVRVGDQGESDVEPFSTRTVNETCKYQLSENKRKRKNYIRQTVRRESLTSLYARHWFYEMKIFELTPKSREFDRCLVESDLNTEG